MVKNLIILTEILDRKVEQLIKAIGTTEISDENYQKYLESFSATMQLLTSINVTLREVAQNAEDKEEENTNESNN